MPQRPARRLALAALAIAAALPVAAVGQSGGDAAAQGWPKPNPPAVVDRFDSKWVMDYGVSDGRCNRAVVESIVKAAPPGGDQRIAVAVVRGSVPVPPTRRELAAPDRGCLGHALELAPEGRAVYWVDAAGGYSYRAITVRTYEALGWPCREFVLEVARGKKTPEIVRARACRIDDGIWGIVT
jgi:hypothetical protein